MPGSKKPKTKYAVVIDESGSVNEDEAITYRTEVLGIVAQTGARPEDISIFHVDSESQMLVHTADETEKLWTRAGYGGTDMRVGIEEAEKIKDLTAIIVLTDGWTPWPGAPTKVPLVALISSVGGVGPETPSWIRRVDVDVSDHP
jgi:predicted metal-dependent peptidase